MTSRRSGEHSGESSGRGTSASGLRPATRYVVYERDEHGVPFALEVIEADQWDGSRLEPPAPHEADARLVRLRGGPLPATPLPRWLHVEGLEHRVAEEPGGYFGVPAADQEAARADGRMAEIGRALWKWSPHFRDPGAQRDEFLLAGSAALRYPQPAPTERARQIELLAAFCGGRASPLGEVAVLAEEARDEALERWLGQGFVDPDGFADALLLERISDQDASAAEKLRFLRAAEVPADAHQHVELAIDRWVLLAQASPWRYVEGDAFAAALAAVRAWRQRYERAYAAHYRAVVVALEGARRTLREAAGAVAALERLNGVRGLGAPVGEAEVAAYRAAQATLDAMPTGPTSGAARTADVTLGREPPLAAQAGASGEGVRRGLEEQRRRLASATIRLVLARPGVAALDRLLQAISASDLRGLERGLSDELAAYIGDLLADGRPTPLEVLVERFPELTAETLDDVTSMFRALLEDGLARSEDGRMRLD